jgi:hypothetical protein
MGKTPEQIEARRKELALRGRMIKANICPTCRAHIERRRRVGEDQQTYALGMVVAEPCQHELYCGTV